MPLAIGNSWHYVDSAKTFTYHYTDTVNRFRAGNGPYWWTMGYHPGEFAIENDTVLYLSYLGQPIAYYVPTPPAGDTVHLNWQLPGVTDVKVFALPTPVTVPAGTFDNCAAYEYDDWWNHARYVFRPGIGIISYERISLQDSSSIDRTVLFSYSLVH